jgi:alkanesulfonate monooxygenase SsuD/methylene tetrahydromethanopterin reductase-like flavin-dependent oxidoreductase (luciferase family)
VKIGLGLPNADKSLADGRLMVDIAQRADVLGFSTLATIGRVSYPTYEELVTLAAAAGATERIGLFTDIVLAATREPVLLAKQAATLDQISGGRFVLGIGVGGRPDDFVITGTDFKTRGRRLDAALELMHSAWRGEPMPGTKQPVTPRPVNGVAVPIMFADREIRDRVHARRRDAGEPEGDDGPGQWSLEGRRPRRQTGVSRPGLLCAW